MGKVISIIIVLAIALTTLVGCGESTEPVNTSIRTYTTEGKETKLVGDPNLTGELTISTTNANSDLWSSAETGDILAKAQKRFNELYPNVKIKTSRLNYPQESLEEYLMRLNTQMMAGEGADIILYNSGAESTPMILDAYKMAKAGAICDMYNYFENDKYFNVKDYNEKVFCGSQFNGGQYIVPISYNYPAIFTSETNVDKYGFDISECNDYEGCLIQLGEMLEKARSENKQQSNFRLASSMISFSGINVVDYEIETVTTDLPDVKKYFELQKKYYSKYSSEQYMVNGGAGVDSMNVVQGLEVVAEQTLPYWEGLVNVEKIQDFDAEVMFPWRDINGKIPAVVYEAAIVNNACSNKELAYKFLKILISEEISLADSHLFSFGVPIAKNAVLPKATMITNKALGKTPDRYNEPLTEEQQKRVQEQLKVIDDIEWVVPVTNAYSIMYMEMLPYLKDEKSYEECIQSAQSKLEIYISE